MKVSAYSRLQRLLKRQQLSVPELHRRLRSGGFRVNIKSLYHLSDEDQPLQRLDMRVAGAICQVCAVPLSEWIVFEQNERRIDLIRKRTRKGLNELEEAELRQLQEAVRQYVDAAHPLPTGSLREMWREVQQAASCLPEHTRDELDSG